MQLYNISSATVRRLFVCKVSMWHSATEIYFKNCPSNLRGPLYPLTMPLSTSFTPLVRGGGIGQLNFKILQLRCLMFIHCTVFTVHQKILSFLNIPRLKQRLSLPSFFSLTFPSFPIFAYGPVELCNMHGQSLISVKS